MVHTITNDYQDIKEAQDGDSEKLTSLVQNNMGLVYSITKRFLGRGYDVEDLNQIGTIGLIKAIKNFNTNYEVKLSTYCVPYILGEIKRFIRDDGKIKVSRSIKELGMKISSIQKEYLEKNGEDIKIEDIAKILGTSKEEIAFAIDATSNNLVTSLTQPVHTGDSSDILVEDILQSEKSEENEIADKLTLKKLIEDLNQRDRSIIILRYFKGKTQTEVAKELGISQVQISRIEKRILLEMREKITC